jgi:hypothetical protein
MEELQWNIGENDGTSTETISRAQVSVSLNGCIYNFHHISLSWLSWPCHYVEI